MAVAGFFRRQGTRAVEYWKNIGNDYLSVGKQAIEDVKNKPAKGAVVGVLLGGLTYAYKTNPSYEDMLNELRERRQQMVLVPTTIHNPVADEELWLRTRLLNQHRLDHYNFLFFSLLVVNNHDNNVRTYHTQDKSMNGWWVANIFRNIFDVGVFGRWFRLEKRLEDYDINHGEFEESTGPSTN